MNEKDKEQIIKWHNLVVEGLVNGLSHTIIDERINDIHFWRLRSRLFGSFSRCVLNLITNQSWEYDEKELLEIANYGYKKESEGK